MAGVAVADRGLAGRLAASWPGIHMASRRLLGPADLRRLAPMFQQVTMSV